MRRLVLALVLATSAFAQSPDAIRAHMKFLASDLLEGRGTGSRGHDLAAQYVATQFEAYGLTSQLQPVRFRVTVPDKSSSIVIERNGQNQTWTFGDQFVTYGDALREDTTADAPVVFAGYGVTAEGYDDYKSVDVKGKIVAVLTGAPKRFSSEIRAHHSSSQVKLDNAAAHGAVGLITILGPYEERFPWQMFIRRAESGQMHWLEASGTPHATRREVQATAILSHAGAEALFSGSQYSLQDVFTHITNDTVRSFALPLRATMHVVSKHGVAESPNVIGIVRGSDPVLRDEYVVYSGHLDHLGISSPVNGDTINNGALDNASGIAALLEIARLMPAAKPRRSILFLATTGEEKGLRGADYFANHPTVPKSALVADLNVDEILMLTPVTDVVALGAEHSTLGDAVARGAKAAGVTVSPDPYPDEVNFVRSDQYPFVRQQIPAVYIGAGYHARDPKVDAQKLQLDWIGTRYHTPQDDMSQPLDFRVGAMVAKVAFETGLYVANRSERPRWNAGDFFAAPR
jgi:hypothetical protein